MAHSFEQFSTHPIYTTEHYTAASITDPLSALAMSTSTGLPMSAPGSTLDYSTLMFVSYAHQLMSTGTTTLDELNNFGVPSCGLIFRNRTSDDLFTIPNWACEVRTKYKESSILSRPVLASSTV